MRFQFNTVPSDTEDEEVVPSYETIWPSPSAEENGPSAQSPAMQFGTQRISLIC